MCQCNFDPCEVEQPHSSILKDCPYVSHVLLNGFLPTFFKRFLDGIVWPLLRKTDTVVWHMEPWHQGFHQSLSDGTVFCPYIRDVDVDHRPAQWWRQKYALNSHTTPVSSLHHGLTGSGLSWAISVLWPRPPLEDFDGYLPRKARSLLSSTGMYTKEVVNGKVRVTGGKKLRSSGAYSKKFGRQVAYLVKKNHGKVPWLIQVTSRYDP